MKFKQRNFYIHPFISFIVFLLLLCSCSDHIPQDKKIFHYNEQTGIASLDPAFAKNQSTMWAIHQLFNTLVEVDDQLTIRPSLAKRWELSADQLVFTFHLRTDVYFHNSPAFTNGKGRLLTAADVAYSLGRITNANVASPGAWIFNNRIDTTDGFRVLNDSTFQLKLLRPFQPILGILSMQYCSIVPKEAVEKYGDDFRRNPVGTGPFEMITWVEGQALLFKKNDRYFEKDSSGIQLPYLDGVKISFFDSKATEFLEFQQHRLDFINDIDPSFKDEILTKTGHLKKQWEGKLILQKHDYLNIEYLGILVDTTNVLLQKSPLRLQKIRQAINYGFDKNKMMLYLRNSIGTAATSGFVPAGMPSFDSGVVKGYSFDAKKAMRLLEDAGFPGGKDLPSIKLLTIPIYADLAAYIANELNLIGIHIQVEVVQKSLLLEQTSKSQALFFRGSWIADYPDAENFLGVFYGKNPSPPNYTRYNNLKYNQLYEQAIAEKSDSIRYQLYRQMDQLIITDAPVVPLWYDMAIHLVHTNIAHFYPNSLNLLELRKVIKK
jgi:oligopeptide transport system substrate-binding protein